MQNLKQHSDEELVKLFKRGNEDAFGELYSRYERKLKRLIFNYISDADEISDIYHDVLMRVVKHIDSFDLKKSFSSWIYQIAINCCKNYISKSIRDSQLVEREKYRVKESDESLLNPEHEMINDLDMKAFGNAVESLDDKFRDVFVLRYDHRMKYAEIAEVLRCSERTAKWRMERAIEKITKELKDKGII